LSCKHKNLRPTRRTGEFSSYVPNISRNKKNGGKCLFIKLSTFGQSRTYIISEHYDLNETL